MRNIYGTQAVAHPSHHINKYAIYSVKVLVYTSVQYSQPMADSCVATLLYMQTKGVDSPTNKTIQNERIKFRMPTNGIMCCRLRAQIPRAILAWEWCVYASDACVQLCSRHLSCVGHYYIIIHAHVTFEYICECKALNFWSLLVICLHEPRHQIWLGAVFLHVWNARMACRPLFNCIPWSFVGVM